jgi:antitoxin (DNA-binding transcriptional repressor) of toxin-antitoxin stability system
MDISVTDFKAQCLDLIRKVEKSRKAITIRRHGRVVARLEPATSATEGLKPWEALQALGGSSDIEPGESAWKDEDFEALR